MNTKGTGGAGCPHYRRVHFIIKERIIWDLHIASFRSSQLSQSINYRKVPVFWVIHATGQNGIHVKFFLNLNLILTCNIHKEGFNSTVNLHIQPKETELDN